MKNINKFFLALLLTVVLIPIQNVSAAMPTASASKTTVSPGVTFNINISFQGEGQISVKVLSNGSGGETFWYPDKKSIQVKAGTVGTMVIEVIAVDVTDNNLTDYLNKTIAKINVKVANPSSTGGGSGGVTPPTPKPTPPVESEADKQKRLEAERLKKEEELKNTPIMKEFIVYSSDDKRNGQVVAQVSPKYGEFEYDLSLPSFISKITVSPTPVNENVKFDYEENYTVDGETIVEVVASTSEVTQNYKFKIKSTDGYGTKIGDHTVYKDTLLDDKMTSLGFTTTSLGEGDDLISFYSSEDVRLQLFVTEDHKAYFGELSETGEVIAEGQAVLSEGKLIFVSSSDEEDVISKTLQGNRYDYIEVPLPNFISEVDESLVALKNVKGWTYDEGQIVYAQEKEYLSVTNELTEKAVVIFDNLNSKERILTMGLGVAFISLLSTNIVYLTVKIIKKRRYQY